MTTDEKRRQHALQVQELNREHLAMAKQLQHTALEAIENLKKQGKFSARCQQQLVKMARDMKRRGEDIPPKLAQLVADSDLAL